VKPLVVGKGGPVRTATREISSKYAFNVARLAPWTAPIRAGIEAGAVDAGGAWTGTSWPVMQ
jgi:hypothetical protein